MKKSDRKRLVELLNEAIFDDVLLIPFEMKAHKCIVEPDLAGASAAENGECVQIFIEDQSGNPDFRLLPPERDEKARIKIRIGALNAELRRVEEPKKRGKKKGSS